jgi:hypothetical protein
MASLSFSAESLAAMDIHKDATEEKASGVAIGANSRICGTCTREYAKYTCPRCNAPYCSMPCYKLHSDGCTEEFFKENVTEELQHRKAPARDAGWERGSTRKERLV